jgi:hypothetical protein
VCDPGRSGTAGRDDVVHGHRRLWVSSQVVRGVGTCNRQAGGSMGQAPHGVVDRGKPGKEECSKRKPVGSRLDIHAARGAYTRQ